MAPVLSKAEQKQIVGSLKPIKFINECFMINKDWWDRWVAYVNDEGENPGRISNNELVEGKSFTEPANWTEISLKPNLQENKDYILVNKEVWNSVKTWYGGGPEIDIFVVGEENDERCVIGKPDLNPVKLSFIFMSKNSGQNFTCLVSLAMTTGQFREFLERKFSINENTEVEFKLTNDYIQLSKSDITLSDIGITKMTVIKVKFSITLYRDGGTGSTGAQYGEGYVDEDLGRAILASYEDAKNSAKANGSIDVARSFDYEKYSKLNKYIEEMKVPPEELGKGFETVKKLISSRMKEEKITVKNKGLHDMLNSLLKIEEHAIDIIKRKDK
jgi:hypothetical protein